MPYEMGRSFPVMIANTPGRAKAFERSMLFITAWGTWLLSILQYNMRGKTISSANFVWPTHFARASTLRKGLPTTFNSFFLRLVDIQLRLNSTNVSRLQVGKGGLPPPQL